MKGKPQNYMRVGLVHFMAFPDAMKDDGLTLESLKTVCDDDCFQAIEITYIKDSALRAQAIDLVKAAGQTVIFGAQPVLLGNDLSLCAADLERRGAALNAGKLCIDQAIEWDAAACAVLSGRDPGEDAREAALAWLTASLRELSEYSRVRNGPPIVLEPFDRRPYGKNQFIGPTREASATAQLVEPYFRGRFGLTVDLSHLPLLGETASEAIAGAGEYLTHVHVGNCVMRDKKHPAYGDAHPMFGDPAGENGVNELAIFLKELLNAGYIGENKQNIVSFELRPYGGQTPAQVIANAKETLQAAWEKLDDGS